jgi:hypothetical protein
MGYQEDIVKAIRRETELIKKQTMLEVISVVTACNTYDEFKRAMYGMALQYFREMEDEGLVEKGTVDRIINSPTSDSEKPEPEMSDDMFMI